MSLLDKQLKDGLLWAKLPQFKRLVSLSRQCVEMMLRDYQDSYVSNSWGKQSIVMAHLVWSVNPKVPNVHFTGEDAEIISNFSEVRDEFLSRMHIPYIERKRETHLREAIEAYNSDVNPQGYFVGLCAYESKGRTRSIENSRNQILMLKNGVARCTPIGWWTQEDLAAYIATYELPMLNTYHRYGLEARTSTGARHDSFTERAVDYLPSSKADILRKRMEER